MLSEVGHVEFDLFFKECMILQHVRGINNAKIAAGHVLCAAHGMPILEWLLQWLNRCASLNQFRVIYFTLQYLYCLNVDRSFILKRDSLL